MERLAFAILFGLFVAIRLWYHQPTKRDSVEIFRRRETLLAAQFSLSLLVCHLLWLSGELLHFAQISCPQALQLFGALLMTASILLLAWVHRVLGANFSARLELQATHQLIQSGPYNVVRHPMYSSGFGFIVGAAFLSSNWLLLLVPGLSFFLLVVLRIPDEEKMLAERFPHQWEQYQARTGRFLPKF